MFTQTQIDSINPKRFKVITANSQNILMQSKSTGHYWQIHSSADPDKRACVVFHKHRKNDPYHCHCKADNLYHAIAKIRSHDKWQMKGRRGSKKKQEEYDEREEDYYTAE